MKVFLNPGHSLEYDCGAVNREFSMTEAVVVHEIGELVCKYLRNAGVDVYCLQQDNLCGEGEYYYSESVVGICNQMKPDIMVSLHCNASGTGNARGTETFAYSLYGQSAVLSECIQNQIVKSLGTVDRKVKEGYHLAVCREVECTSCLVELAFIDNHDDCLLLARRKDDFARAVARGITDYQKKQSMIVS